MQTGAQAYARVAQTTAAPRDVEAQVLLKAAYGLQSVIDSGASDAAKAHEAMRFNMKVWTVLCTAATDAKNPLPMDVKANVGSLGVFIMNHTMTQFAAPVLDVERLKILVQINRDVAAGLRGSASDEAQSAQPAA